MEPIGLTTRAGGSAAAAERWNAAEAAPDIPPAVSPPASTPSLSQVLWAAAHPPERQPPSVGRVTCPGCQSEYGLSPELVPPWGAQVRCPRCEQVFSVGARAEADAIVSSVRDRDPVAWEHACSGDRLWAEFGESLLEAYAGLRERLGVQVAARAFRRALEAAAPDVAWFAPPTPKNPLGTGPGENGTLFERRQSS